MTLVATATLAACQVDDAAYEREGHRDVIKPARAPSPVARMETDFLGVVLSREAIDVGARVEGRVERVLAQPGERVRRGASLASIDVTPTRREQPIAQAMLAQAQADVESAQLEVEQARERLVRRRASTPAGTPLVSGEDLSNADYQARMAGVRLTRARAVAAERRARVEQIMQAVADAEIRAPFDGIVAARYVDTGASVARGAPIVRLVSVGEPRVRFAVPEEQLHVVTAGGAVHVTFDGNLAAAKGTVEHIAPEVDAASRMVFVEARLAVDPGREDEALFGRIAHVDVRGRQ